MAVSKARALLACLVLSSLAAGCISDGTPAASPSPHVDADDGPHANALAEDGSQAGAQGDDAPSDGSRSDAPQSGAGDPAQSGEDEEVGDDADDEAPAGAPEAADPPQGPQAGTPGTHAVPKRNDGPVEVATDGQFVARRTVTIDNDFGGAARSDLELKSFNGDVSVKPSTDGGYHLVAVLHGRGATQDEARQALDLLTLTASDELEDGTLWLAFVLTSGQPTLVPPITVPTGVSNGARFELAVPPQPAHDVEAGTSNGDVVVLGLHGPRLQAGSANGDLVVHGAFGALGLGTSNGAIDLDGTFHDVLAGTTNGEVRADLWPLRSGTVRLATSNDDIAVGLASGAAAYDITGDTTNGEVRFDLEGRQSEDESHGTFRSAHWATAEVRVTLDLDTANASILVDEA